MRTGWPKTVVILNNKKDCTKCKINKDLSCFYPSSSKPSGYHSWCKDCEIAYTKEYLKSERGREKVNNWRKSETGKISYRAAQIRRNAKLREGRKTDPDRFHSYDLKKRIGISFEDKTAKLTSQGGKCGICGSDKPNTKGTWFADHCHRTNKFRGVLCGKCNSMLGYADDQIPVLFKAAYYLLEYENGR